MASKKKPKKKAPKKKPAKRSAPKKSAPKKSAPKKSAPKKSAPKKAATRFGTFDELVAGISDDMRALMHEARNVILEVHPDATEVVRLGDRAATYGLGPAKMSEGHTYLIPQKDYVNLGFYYGTSLPDPEQLLEGTGANMRHVKVRASADVQRARPLIAAALAERRAKLGR